LNLAAVVSDEEALLLCPRRQVRTIFLTPDVRTEAPTMRFEYNRIFTGIVLLE